jgi:uncharacterized protein YdhG (YjbR/CyaY superfamily)
MEQLRAAIRAGAPDAVEVISYKMPAFKSNGRFLVSYDAYKRHYSLFPASEAVMRTLSAEIEPFLAGRGTIRFPSDAPIPTDLVTKVAEIRVRETAASDAR